MSERTGISILGSVGLLALAIGAVCPARADVITFSGVGPGAGSHPVASPYIELTYSISAPGGLYYLGTGDPRYAGEDNLFDNNYEDITTLTTTNNNAFAIQSIDLAEMYQGSPTPDEVTTFTGTLVGGGTVTQTFDVTNFQFQPFQFDADFTDLSSLSWTAPIFTPQFANIQLNEVGPLPAPEPASIALLGGALAFFGLWQWSGRRRSKPSISI